MPLSPCTLLRNASIRLIDIAARGSASARRDDLAALGLLVDQLLERHRIAVAVALRARTWRPCAPTSSVASATISASSFISRQIVEIGAGRLDLVGIAQNLHHQSLIDRPDRHQMLAAAHGDLPDADLAHLAQAHSRMTR